MQARSAGSAEWWGATVGATVEASAVTAVQEAATREEALVAAAMVSVDTARVAGAMALAAVAGLVG